MIGLWPKGGDVYKFNRYTLYAAVSISFFISAIGVLLIIDLFFVDSDFEDLEEMTLIYVAEFLVIIKVYCFMRNIKLIKHLMATLNTDMFQPKTIQQKMLIKPALNFWKLVYNIFTAAGGPLTSLWVFLPLLTKTKKIALPVSVWYPYDIQASPMYEITYLYQIVSVFYIVVAIYNIDMLISALMMYTGAQCDILCDNLRNLEDNESRNFNRKLIDCIRHHQEILIFAENCNEFFNLIFLGQFFGSSVLIALILFRLVLNNQSYIQIFTHFLLVTFYMVQIFTYCWFGNEVQVKSRQIPYSVFESDWVQHSLEIRKSMIIFVIRSHRPVKLSAFNLFYLSLDVYIKVIVTTRL
ncbi:7tm 6 domain containing protein [Asbolus verrucosus]|uniref:Odorant receptor n=1 Tax=Asbolus verrucosus TaxID=1661398 RepID=A0A482V8H4_ASBVE|nr:7tm 6 domain containing protein [Asbolus verrucosus]